MAKEKKEKTVKQEIKSYRIKQYSLFGGEFAVAFAPFITIGLINYKQYFDQIEGVKVGIGFILALMVMGFTVYAMSKGKLKEYGYRGSLVTIAIALFVCGVMAWLFSSILNDLMTICFFGALGVIGAFGRLLNPYHVPSTLLITLYVLSHLNLHRCMCYHYPHR